MLQNHMTIYIVLCLRGAKFFDNRLKYDSYVFGIDYLLLYEPLNPFLLFRVYRKHNHHIYRGLLFVPNRRVDNFH